jgi:hypothetical protein
MSFTLTGNSILDLAASQTLTILYMSEAAIFMENLDDIGSFFSRIKSNPPAVAWYQKASGLKLKRLSDFDDPCILTTAFGIQTLSLLSDLLSKYKLESYLAESSLHEEWKAIALLQLGFCLELLAKRKFNAMEYSLVLEAGIVLINKIQQDDFTYEYKQELEKLYQNLMFNIDINSTGTMELACVIRSISNWNEINNYIHRDEYLTNLVLEVLSRKSYAGIFHFGPCGKASLPLGQQFFILASLLQSYSFVKLDCVLEEIFNIFTTLYQVAYIDTLELFAFQRRKISYTAFDAGAVLSGLKYIAYYSAENSAQKKLINQLIDVFLEYLTKSYYESHYTEIRKLLKWTFLRHEGKAVIERKPVIRTSLPKYVYFRYPNAEINWNRKGIVNQMDIFYLCTVLLSFLDEKSPGSEENYVHYPKMSEIDSLEMLLRILLNKGK